MVTVTLGWLLIIALLAAILAILDGITRMRGNTSALAIVEVLFGVLLLLSLFFAFPAPLGAFVFAFVLVVLLLVSLLSRGGSRRTSIITVIALILMVITALLYSGWVSIPGVN
ncbi:MAG: hypothetical protein ABIW32_07430 [Terrimesophilobacter sp.]